MRPTSAKNKLTSAMALVAALAAMSAIPALRAQRATPAQGGPEQTQGAPAQNAAVDQNDVDDTALMEAAGVEDDDADADSQDEAAAFGFSQPQVVLGTIDGRNYIAPTGAYRIRIPVYPELGGEIEDTFNVTTFLDYYGDLYTIGCFPMDVTFRGQEAKLGRKNFLVWFFQNFVQADFVRNLPKTTAEPDATFNPKVQGGALFTQLLIPDGSVYMDRVFIFNPPKPVVAKRGNLVFIHGNFIYVLSSEMSERVFEHDSYNRTPADEADILRQRLYDLLGQMTFAPVDYVSVGDISPDDSSASMSMPVMTSSTAGNVAPDLTSPAQPSDTGTSLK